MNTDDFISSLSEKTGRDADDTARLVSSLTDIIVGGMQDGKAVSLQGFGIFEVKKRPEKIDADKFYDLDFLLQPTYYTLPSGSKLALIIYSTDEGMTKRPLEKETYTVDLANTEIKFYEK